MFKTNNSDESHCQNTPPQVRKEMENINLFPKRLLEEEFKNRYVFRSVVRLHILQI